MIASVTCASGVFAAEQEVQIIKPDEQDTAPKGALLDSEKFEIGFSLGQVAVEDFNSQGATNINITYHINSDFSLLFESGKADIDPATFEEVLGRNYLSESDREFNYQTLAGGYKLTHGRSFLGASSKYESNIYLLFGVDRIEFARNDETGFMLGAKYKTVLTDWLTWDLSIKNHFFEREFNGESKQTQNTELSFGLNVMF